MKALIIDDNEKARIALKSDLKDYCPELNVIGEADGVASAFSAIQDLNPDLLFLDIQMGDGTGFDLLEKFKALGDYSFTVIFTTAYDQYAIKAFRYAAADYLLKPIDADELVSAVNRLSKKVEKPVAQLQLELLLQQIGTKKQEKIALPEADRVHVVEINDIVHCQSDKNYTTFFLSKGKEITVSKTLKEYDELLSEQGFLCVHHFHLINLQHVKERVKLNGPYLILSDGSEVPVSSRKKDLLLQKMKELW